MGPPSVCQSPIGILRFFWAQGGSGGHLEKMYILYTANLQEPVLLGQPQMVDPETGGCLVARVIGRLRHVVSCLHRIVVFIFYRNDRIFLLPTIHFQGPCWFQGGQKNLRLVAYPWFTEFFTSQVVHFFFHQLYGTLPSHIPGGLRPPQTDNFQKRIPAKFLGKKGFLPWISLSKPTSHIQKMLVGFEFAIVWG